MKRTWLKALMLAMIACASFGCPINPKEVEDLMYIMNQTRIEFTLRDEDDEGERGPTKHTLVIERLKAVDQITGAASPRRSEKGGTAEIVVSRNKLPGANHVLIHQLTSLTEASPDRTRQRCAGHLP